MKLFVASALLAFCTIQMVSGVTNLETLRAGIARQKSSVQTTLNRLQRYNRDFSYNLGNKLSDAKINAMQQINNIVNPTLTNIEAATKKSTADGKNASSCYDSARSRLRLYSLTGFDDLETCRKNVLSSISRTQSNIDSTIQTGQQVLSYYDSIFPSCSTTNAQQTEACITGKLPEGVRLTRAFETSTDSVITSSTSASNQAYTDAVNCNNGPVKNVRDGATSVQADANSCIAAL